MSSLEIDKKKKDELIETLDKEDVISSDESDMEGGRKIFRVKSISGRSDEMTNIFIKLDEISKDKAEKKGPSMKSRVRGFVQSKKNMPKNIPKWMVKK